MNHRVKQYLKYHRIAKTLHGVHSPFVYEFIDKGLRKNKNVEGNLIFSTSNHKKLVNKIIAYFQCKHILWLTNKDGHTETFIAIEKETKNEMSIKSERFDFAKYKNYPQPDLFLFDLADSSDLALAWEKYKTKMRATDIVLITSIHESKEKTEEWERICGDNVVKLSMDLYKIGLLFFRDDFKEKQHFVVK